MWQAIISFLGGPVIAGLLKAYNAHLAAQTTDEQTAANLAAKEVAIQQRELELQTQYRIAEIGHWYEPDKIMGYCVAVLLAKIIVWDTCLGWGVTNLHNGWMTTTTNIIIGSYFGKRGIENVTRIFMGKR